MVVPTISSGALRKLLDAMSDAGVARDEAMSELGLDARVFDDADGRVPIERLHAAWELALRHAEAAKRELAAPCYEPGDYGLVGFVAMSSATLGEALGHVVRFLALWTDDPRMVLDADGTLSVVYRHPFADGPGLRASTEAAPIEIVHGARVLSQRRIVPREVTFAHPRPRHAAALAARFGCPVRFGAAACAVSFHDEDLRVPLPRADAQLAAYLQRAAADALARRSGVDETPLARVRAILAEELQRGVPSIEQVARRLVSSERTLRRRLEESGTSFRELLDDTRARLAEGYVRDRRIPLTQVAFLLGFSEPSTFHRAFKRWTGVTPAAFRAKA